MAALNKSAVEPINDKLNFFDNGFMVLGNFLLNLGLVQLLAATERQPYFTYEEYGFICSACN